MDSKNAINNFTLTLDNKEQARFITKGNGPFVCYIVGFGSFYLDCLTGLEDKLTLVTCDGLWSQYKYEAIDEEKINCTNLENILARENLVVKKIKEYFNCDKVCLIGFSAPAAIAFKYALDNPQDIACVIGTGAGLCELDPSFENTNQFFYKNASPERIHEFEKNMANYEKLLQGNVKAKSLPNTNFMISSNNERFMTPNSKYLELARCLLPKLAYNYQNFLDATLHHWTSNPIGQVVCQPMREHFFNNIQPKIDTLRLLQKIEEQSAMPVLLIHGSHDFITPLDKATEQKLLSYKYVKLKVYQNNAHLTYLENSNQYSADINAFVSMYTPRKKVYQIFNVVEFKYPDNTEQQLSKSYIERRCFK